jgi:integrase
MSKTSHLYRRGNTLYFRLSVPDRFRSILHVSELTQSLRTQSREIAIPVAYKLAGEAKQLFLNLDAAMTNKSKSEVTYALELLLKATEENKKIINNNEDKESYDIKSPEVFKSPMTIKRQAYAKSELKLQYVRDQKEQLQEEVWSLISNHRKDLKEVEINTKAEAFETLKSLSAFSSPIHQGAAIIQKVVKSTAPLLSAIYPEFVKGHSRNQKKLGTFGNLFIKGYLGDKQIDLITQKEVNKFFKLLVQVGGGRGGSTDAYNNLDIHERILEAEKNNDVLMGLSTFKNTYVGSARQFFKFLNLNYEDSAPVITVDHINYEDFGGLRAKGENKQRSLRIDEIVLLMNDRTMANFANSSKESHKFWLPMIGLFTGARVNEICQLNPQKDVIQDEKTGIWYFNLTDDDAGVGVEKSHKNEHSMRKVPIHSKLIESGFLNYLDKVRALKHDRIFVGFKPKSGKASYYAEYFFREYLKHIGLYDNVTIGKNVLGMHCLRGTFISHTVKGLMSSGDSRKQALSKIQPIVGHADGLADENGKDLSVTAGYIDEDILYSVSDNLESLKVIIEALDYEISFPILNS